MKQAVGIDTVQIARFTGWHKYSDAQLLRCFSKDEIAYARSNNHFFAARLAARLAAKEAFLKALYQLIPITKLSLFQILRCVQVVKKENGSVFLAVDWQRLHLVHYQQATINLSITHSDCCASAVVTIVI